MEGASQKGYVTPYGFSAGKTGNCLVYYGLENTCRNVVTLNEILNGVNGATVVDEDTPLCIGEDATKCNSANLREQCLLNNWVEEIRDWEKQKDSPGN